MLPADIQSNDYYATVHGNVLNADHLHVFEYMLRVLKEFEQLPGHLTQVPHLLSMDDLLRVKQGHLVPLARAVLRSATAHVTSCELCLAKGFICEFCKQKEVIFPFQSGTCTRCKECKTCFHKDCFQDEECPKCIRMKLRRQLLDDNPSSRLHKDHL